MVAKSLKDATCEELSSFSEICEPLIRHVREHWEWKEFKPKGYEQFSKDYYEDYYEDDEESKKAIRTFEGLTNETHCSLAFHVQTARDQVCYSDRSQNRDPLTTLISSCVAFGMAVGNERTTRENNIEQSGLNKITRLLLEAAKETLQDHNETER